MQELVEVDAKNEENGVTPVEEKKFDHIDHIDGTVCDNGKKNEEEKKARWLFWATQNVDCDHGFMQKKLKVVAKEKTVIILGEEKNSNSEYHVHATISKMAR